MRCPKCDFVNPDYAVVCEKCGEFLPKVDLTAKNSEPILDPGGEKRIRCSYCWHSNPGEAEICEVCGMPLNYVPLPESEGEYVLPTREDLLPKVEESGTPDNPVPRGKIRCRNCWHDNTLGAVVCEQCGKRLQGEETINYKMFRDLRTQTIDCKYCGQEVSWGAMTCPYCGAQPRTGVRPHDDDEDEEDPILFQLVDRINEIRAEREKEKQAEIEKIEMSKRSGTWVPYGRVRCRACWYDNPRNTEFCQSCGARLRGNAQRSVVGKKYCECGYEGNASDATICVKCHGWIRRKCPYCGYQNDTGVTICANCHTRVATPKKNL